MTSSLEMYNARLATAMAKLDPIADADILAVLATDVDHSPAYHDGYEVQMDADDSGVVDAEFTHGAYNVAHTARWTTAQSLPSVGTLWADDAHSGFVGPLAPALGPRFRARFSAAKFYAAQRLATGKADRAAFPYLYNAKRMRVDVTNTRSFNAARARMSGASE